MRHTDLAVMRATACAAALIGSLFVGSTDANEQNRSSRPACSCPDTVNNQLHPDAAESTAKMTLDAADETATLHAVHIGLTEIPDGSSFVWRRAHGRLSGVVRPVFSFKNADGEVCRQLTLTLRSGTYTRTIEGIACRDPDGRWALEG